MTISKTEIFKNTFTYTFNSKALNKEKYFTVTFPEDYFDTQKNYPLLVMLHGMGRNHNTVVNHEALRRIFCSTSFITVFPDGEKGCYINSETKEESRYMDYLDEVLALVDKYLRVLRESNYRAIAGWSMGAFGAANYIMNRIGRFDTFAAIIGLLDYPSMQYDELHNYPLTEVLPKNQKDWSKYQACANVDSFKNINIMLYTGSSAFDCLMNRSFHKRLSEQNIEHCYIEESGGHIWDTVERAIPIVLDFCLKNITLK